MVYTKEEVYNMVAKITSDTMARYCTSIVINQLGSKEEQDKEFKNMKRLLNMKVGN